jgi:hypothetical protein
MPCQIVFVVFAVGEAFEGWTRRERTAYVEPRGRERVDTARGLIVCQGVESSRVFLFPSFRDNRDNCDRAIRGGLTEEHGLEKMHQMTDSPRIGFSKNS